MQTCTRINEFQQGSGLIQLHATLRQLNFHLFFTTLADSNSEILQEGRKDSLVIAGLQSGSILFFIR